MIVFRCRLSGFNSKETNCIPTYSMCPFLYSTINNNNHVANKRFSKRKRFVDGYSIIFTASTIEFCTNYIILYYRWASYIFPLIIYYTIWGKIEIVGCSGVWSGGWWGIYHPHPCAFFYIPFTWLDFERFFSFKAPSVNVILSTKISSTRIMIL